VPPVPEGLPPLGAPPVPALVWGVAPLPPTALTEPLRPECPAVSLAPPNVCPALDEGVPAEPLPLLEIGGSEALGPGSFAEQASQSPGKIAAIAARRICRERAESDVDIDSIEHAAEA
jgi:hypothetical protein